MKQTNFAVSLAAVTGLLGLSAAAGDLAVNMIVPTTAVKAGAPFVYEIAISYNGSVPATNIRLFNTIPFGVQLISVEGASSQPVYEGAYMVLTVADLPAGISAKTVRLHARHGFPGFFNGSTTIDATADNSQSGNEFSSKQTSAIAPDNLDQDNLPDWWEQLNGLNTQSSAGDDGPAGDLDKDGMTNYEEFVADTKANDASSTLRLNFNRQQNGDVVFTFASSNIRRYGYRLGNSLSQLTDPLELGNGSGGTLQLARLASGYSQDLFYVLEARLPQ